MKLKLHDAIKSIDYEDLVELNRDLKQGALNTRQLVEEQIVNKEREMGKTCHMCQSEIDPSNTNNFTLLFGPEGLRRKANFCAIDCMKYFISDLERRRNAYKQKALKEGSVLNDKKD